MSRLDKLLEKLYPENIQEVITSVDNCFDGVVYKSDDTSWYKNIQLYVSYPDSFHNGDVADFRTLSKQLPRIKSLGFNCIHVLPFLASPMVDMGFDVSDYFLVREELGGGKALDRFIEKAKEQGIKVMMDVVLNHVSEEHRWYRQAVSGDEFYRDFFVWRDAKPAFVRKFTDDHGVWARYEYEGKQVDARIIFPEQVGEIPHWLQAEDDNWYYHTFYPHQLDLNWYNHHVFVSFAKVLVYWAKKGMAFRLDAVPFVSKQIEKGLIESNPRVHDIVRALNLIVKHVNQESVFLVEANQPATEVKKYFGNSKVESELAYNFNLMNAMWASLLSGDASHIWKSLDEIGDIPDHADWITFLRNHDELTLEYATLEQRELILRSLKGRGKPFREGFGYAGRTYNFLENDIDRVLMAYFLLASLPGNPAIIYGDEFGMEYSNTFMKYQTKWKRKRFANPDIANDHRDINRNPVLLGDEDDTKEAHILSKKLGEIYSQRAELGVFHFKNLHKVDSVDNVFAAQYREGNQNIQVFVNLSEQTVQLESQGDQLVHVGDVSVQGNTVKLSKYAGIWLSSS